MENSKDVTFYQFDLAKGNKPNLVAILMHQQNISLQGAVNLAGNMIKDAFATFCSLEHSLLESVDPEKGAIGLSVLWTSLVPSGNNNSSETVSDERNLDGCPELYHQAEGLYCGYS